MTPEKKCYQMVVFDWEGTLSDDFSFIFHSIVKEATKNGWHSPSETQARQHVSLGLPKLVALLYPNAQPIELNALLMRVNQHYFAEKKPILFENAFNFIQTLKQHGCYIAIASNRSLSGLRQAVELTGLTDYMDDICSISHFDAKPSNAMLIYLMNKYQLTPDKVLMIGDSLTDVTMAQASAVDAIVIDMNRDNQHLFHLIRPLAVFHDYDSLSSFVLPYIMKNGGM